MKKILISALIGFVLGGIIAKYLFVGSFLNVFWWGMFGMGIGAWSHSKTEAIKNAGVYGFTLSFVFMLFGYQGSAPILSRMPFFAILGLVGAVCGIISGLVGFYGKKGITR